MSKGRETLQQSSFLATNIIAKKCKTIVSSCSGDECRILNYLVFDIIVCVWACVFVCAYVRVYMCVSKNDRERIVCLLYHLLVNIRTLPACHFAQVFQPLENALPRKLQADKLYVFDLDIASYRSRLNVRTLNHVPIKSTLLEIIKYCYNKILFFYR